MGLFDNFLDAMRINPDESGEFLNPAYDDDEDEGEEEPVKVVKNKKSVKASNKQTGKEKTAREYKHESEDEEVVNETKEKQTKTSAGVITEIHSVKKSSFGSAGETYILKPTSFDDVKKITENLRNNRTIVLSLEGLDVTLAHRIIDFAFGTVHAVDGKLEEISRCIFVIAPSSARILGDLSEGGNSLDRNNPRY